MDGEFAKTIVEALEEVAEFSRDDLDDAPLIEDWVITGAFAPCLIGRVTGHPTVRDGRLVHTSVLIAISVREGWARTLNRFYQLGRPLGERRVH